MRAIRGLLALAVALTLVGCDGGIDGTGDANYVTGSGAITQLAPGDRDEPVALSGTTLQDEPIDLAELRGQVVVLNVWGSWCTPCRAEAPLLQEASEQVDAAFVGMSFRETSFDNARSFEREFSITYPTIADDGEGAIALGRYAPRSPPTTYVLDRQGRVAAFITDQVRSAATLEDLVEEVASEHG